MDWEELEVVSSSLVGRRRVNEDRVVTKQNPEAGYVIAGVYDGHNGAKTSSHLAKHLHRDVMHEMEALAHNGPSQRFRLCCCARRRTFQQAVVHALHTCFTECDDRIQYGNRKTHEPSGSTAVLTIVDSTHIYVANVGDSRAVLCRGGKALPVSNDHKPYLDREKQYIESKGGFVAGKYMINPMTSEALAVSRAFGDIAFRKKPNNILSCKPDVVHMRRSRHDRFLLLATDGLFDVMSNQEVCDAVMKSYSNPGVPCADIAKELAEEAICQGSMDNVSIVIVFFSREGPSEASLSSHSMQWSRVSGSLGRQLRNFASFTSRGSKHSQHKPDANQPIPLEPVPEPQDTIPVGDADQ